MAIISAIMAAYILFNVIKFLVKVFSEYGFLKGLIILIITPILIMAGLLVLSGVIYLIQNLGSLFDKYQVKFMISFIVSFALAALGLFISLVKQLSYDHNYAKKPLFIKGLLLGLCISAIFYCNTQISLANNNFTNYPENVTLENSLQSPGEVTKTLSYIAELDGVKIGSYISTEENIKNSGFMRKKDVFDIKIEQVGAKSITTEIYNKSNLIIPERIDALQIMNIPNLEEIRTNFNSLSDNLKKSLALEDMAISTSNQVYIKDNQIMPNYKKELISGKIITSDKTLNLPKNYVSDLSKAGLNLIGSSQKEMNFNLYDPMENSFKNYALIDQGKTTYKNQAARKFIFIIKDNNQKAQMLLKYDKSQNLGDMLYMEMPFTGNKLIKFY